MPLHGVQDARLDNCVCQHCSVMTRRSARTLRLLQMTLPRMLRLRCTPESRWVACDDEAPSSWHQQDLQWICAAQNLLESPQRALLHTGLQLTFVS